MLLIDRLNLKAKLGTQIDLTFNDVEQKFFDRAMTTQTFEEVIELSKELFEYCEKELEEKQQNQEDTSAYNMPVQSEQGQDDEQSEGDAQEGQGNGMNVVTGTLMNNQKKKVSLLHHQKKKAMMAKTRPRLKHLLQQKKVWMVKQKILTVLLLVLSLSLTKHLRKALRS